MLKIEEYQMKGLRVFLILVLVLSPTFGLFAQVNQPVLECVSVNADGTVTLNWENALDAGPGESHDVYRNDGSGFQFLQSLPFPVNTYMDAGVDASTQSIEYYVLLNTSPADIPKDTVSTIFLELPPSGSSSIAELEWNFPFNPMPDEGEFVVEKREGLEPFADLVTLPTDQNTYSDTLFGVCDSTDFSYRISFRTAECTMYSQVVTKAFIDNDGPPQPQVETISVLPWNGNVILFWYPVTEPDLDQYVIQRIQNGFITVGNQPADSTSFLYQGGAGDAGTVTLAIRAEDECGNENSFENTFTTIHTQASFTDCELNSFITWTPYEGWPEGVERYEIRAIVNGTQDVFFDSLPPDASEFQADVLPDTEYLFYVRAYSNGDQRPSDSNGVLIVTDYPDIIDYQYLSSVSVNDMNQIEVTLVQDPNGEGITYELYRAEGDGQFQLIADLNATEDNTMVYTDTDVRPGDVRYTYFWKAYDGCGQFISDSNQGRNIVLLSRTNDDDLINRIMWSPYGDWNAGVEEYRIWRSLGGTEDFELFMSNGPGEIFLEDDVEDFLEVEGRFCYRIEAIESGNPFGVQGKSFSNITCAVQPPVVWVPNAMVYGGFNDEFKPVLGFVDFDSYAMEIYNKWGELLFETEDYTEAWDGTFRGNPVREDYYRYIISFRDGDGRPIVEEGVLYVLGNQE